VSVNLALCVPEWGNGNRQKGLLVLFRRIPLTKKADTPPLEFGDFPETVTYRTFVRLSSDFGKNHSTLTTLENNKQARSFRACLGKGGEVLRNFFRKQAVGVQTYGRRSFRKSGNF